MLYTPLLCIGVSMSAPPLFLCALQAQAIIEHNHEQRKQQKQDFPGTMLAVAFYAHSCFTRSCRTIWVLAEQKVVSHEKRCFL
jgi:hypothetical protein